MSGKRFPDDDEPLLGPDAGSDYGSLSSASGPDEDTARSSLNPGVADEAMQPGARNAEAFTEGWGKKTVVAAYAAVFLVFLGNSLEQQATSNLSSYVTSDFSRHSLVSTVAVVSSTVGGVARVPIARLIDVWGRGLILMAMCNNIATYAAAQVFYWLGFDGIGYVLHVFLADVSSLENRAIAFAFSSTPYILTTFLGPAVAQWFFDFSSWRWAFVVFAITTPLISTPMIALFFMKQQLRPKEQGADSNSRSSSKKEGFMKFMTEFDIVGTLLFLTGITLVLLPLSLRSYENNGWRSPTVLLESILGYGSLCLFVVWEYKYASVKLIPYHIFAERTILGACMLSAVLMLSFNIYNTYLLSFLQVVHNQTIRDAGYIANIFNITSCVLGLGIGWAIRKSGKFKWLALLALPFRLLGTLLLIPATRPTAPLSLLLSSQLLLASSGATLIMCAQTGIMAAVPHAYVAVALAALLLFSSIGGSVGTAIAGAVWRRELPGLLRAYLPPGQKGEAERVFADLKRALSWPVGSVERVAVQRAYAGALAVLVRLAAGLTLPAVLCVVVWRDLPVKKREGEEEAGEDGAKADRLRD